MALRRCCFGSFAWILVVTILSAHVCRGDSEITHDDVYTPSQPGCDNSFVLVKIRNWMDNMEATELVGVSARFGEKISDRNVEGEAIPLALPSIGTSCNSSSIPLTGQAAMVRRGDCTFTSMARAAQAAGAKALIVINYKEELCKMVCSDNDTFTDIIILSVLVPKSAGDTLEASLLRGETDSSFAMELVPV